MHSSRMRTVHLLTTSCSILLGGGAVGVCPWGVSAWEGVSAQGRVYLWSPGGSVCRGGGYTSPVVRQTPVKTLPSQTSFVGGINSEIMAMLMLEIVAIMPNKANLYTQFPHKLPYQRHFWMRAPF